MIYCHPFSTETVDYQNSVHTVAKYSGFIMAWEFSYLPPSKLLVDSNSQKNPPQTKNKQTNQKTTTKQTKHQPTKQKPPKTKQKTHPNKTQNKTHKTKIRKKKTFYEI